MSSLFFIVIGFLSVLVTLFPIIKADNRGVFEGLFYEIYIFMLRHELIKDPVEKNQKKMVIILKNHLNDNAPAS